MEKIENSGNVGIRAQLTNLYKTFKNPAIYLPALFVFLWQATPSVDSALFFFTTNELHFQPEFLGQVRLLGSLASLAGVLAFRYLLKDKPIKDIILWTTLLSVPLGLTQVLLTSHVNRDYGIPDKLFALTDTVVLSVLGQIAFMPTLVLAAKLCPPGVEGTLFATLMSIFKTIKLQCYANDNISCCFISNTIRISILNCLTLCFVISDI